MTLRQGEGNNTIVVKERSIELHLTSISLDDFSDWSCMIVSGILVK